MKRYIFCFFCAFSLFQQGCDTLSGGEAVFEIENIVELRDSQKMKVKELAIALKLIEEHKILILEKWNEHIS